MNKGFTLIEVIAIIVIFVGIFLISFPTLTNMAKNDNDKMYTNMVNNLCTAGKTYMYSNLDDFPELSIVGSEIEILVNELMLYGNVNKDLVNPKTEISVDDSTLKYIVLDDLSLTCEYIEE